MIDITAEVHEGFQNETCPYPRGGTRANAWAFGQTLAGYKHPLPRKVLVDRWHIVFADGRKWRLDPVLNKFVHISE